jgi:hypothetical protein
MLVDSDGALGCIFEGGRRVREKGHEFLLPAPLFLRTREAIPYPVPKPSEGHSVFPKHSHYTQT